MKWMFHDIKRGKLIFKLEEHEIVDAMQHHLYFTHPETNEPSSKRIDVHIGPATVNSNWELVFNFPDDIPLHMGRCDFYVTGHSDMKGRYVVATGYTVGNIITCNQAMSKRN